MNYLFKIQEKIVPEIISLAEERYTILRSIYYNQPIGRRLLAEKTTLSERTIRNELNFLETKGLVEVSRSGTVITRTGQEFLNELDKYIKELKGLKNLEEEVKKVLGLKQVLLVPGGLEYSTIKQEIGRFTAKYLKGLLKDDDILAVTGGTTLAQVANAMRSTSNPMEVMVVPGRGGLGEEVEIQANTIAATIAKKIGGKYQLLHLPDNIKEENANRIVAEPSIQKTLNQLKKTNILLHGVGTAEEMAQRRGMSPQQIKALIDRGAIGEAFGYYFNEQGDIVYTTSSVGLHLNDLTNIDTVIAVAGGQEKARAIKAVVSPDYQDILITDELTARRILELKGR
ncbi:sugar-binding transcriptional regulator [Halothermothrix orenii]|uniref:Transcriptional regulator, DeoR family n=1 Tax=Halothermothrix orenii (strain H 168 / OCM 544 / DSM 9562) TaxID=373903 RepID=B8CYG4_HALOH|nr:sugar-binding domain-containing protein [Halothermothrix orenii]ACL70333.1 transcriptional regulator, DeoR family [Halothermothrix orenii H 168]